MGLKHLSKNKLMRMGVRNWMKEYEDLVIPYEAPLNKKRPREVFVEYASLGLLGLIMLIVCLGLISLLQ